MVFYYNGTNSIEIASPLFRRNRESGRKMKHITDIY